MSVVPEPTRHRFSRAHYDRMIDAGIFGPQDHVELLDGEIIDMAPQKSRHATAVTLVADALRSAFGPGVTVRVQLPFNLDDHSAPEPDVAVVPGKPRDYRDAHPARALLICEIADTTRAYDRGRKLSAYARAGVPEYWILDLNEETLEVCRVPQHSGYAQQRVLPSDAQVSPLEILTQHLLVGDLLP
jgi:Uma2 family endonuclease